MKTKNIKSNNKINKTEETGRTKVQSALPTESRIVNILNMLKKKAGAVSVSSESTNNVAYSPNLPKEPYPTFSGDDDRQTKLKRQWEDLGL